jgi:hypothetical protein
MSADYSRRRQIVSNSAEMQDNESQKSSGSAKLVGSTLLVIIALISAWIAIAYFHVAYLQGYITGIITPNGSVLRITLIAAFGGFILSIPILRSLSRKGKASQVKIEPVPQFRNPQVHPLFTTPRPARDANFVIRKTRNRGRISRNRAGERLPPTYQE